MKIERILIAILAIAVVVLAGLLVRQGEKPIDIEAERAAIRNVDAEWLRAAQAKNIDRVLSFYSDDASMLPPNSPVVAGKESIRALWSQLVANPGFAIIWETTKLEVAQGGNLAYQVANLEITVTDPKGKPVTERSKYVGIWKKQPDNSWKVVTEIWNSDQPPAPAPSKS